MEQPNIIFILSDEQRWDSLGCYGQPMPVTPNLDRLAAEGVRFENAFTAQPVCGPVRSSLQAGKWPSELGTHLNHRHLPLHTVKLATLLHGAGYETGYIGKWHLASGPNDTEPEIYREGRVLPVPPEYRGGYQYWLAADVLEYCSHAYDGYCFDTDNKARYFPVGRYRVDAMTDWVLEYLQGRDGQKPFFLFVSYLEPHFQNDHGRDYRSYEGPTGSKERWKGCTIPQDLLECDGGNYEGNYEDYLGCCNNLDANIGRIRDTLQDLGLADNTLLIYTSDHGDHFRTRNHTEKNACHDACLRIPLILNGPGFRRGTVNGNLVSLIDMPKTVLTAAGAGIPADWAGRPLQEALEQDGWRESVFAQLSSTQVGRCLRTYRWKYSVEDPAMPRDQAQPPRSDRYTETFLYDLENDPHELNNLVNDPRYEETRVRLRRLLLEHIREAEGVTADIQPPHSCCPTGGPSHG